MLGLNPSYEKTINFLPIMILRLSCKLRVSFICHLCKGYVYDHVYSKTLSAPLTETMRDHTFKVEFVPAEEYEAMRDRYNSSFHSCYILASADMMASTPGSKPHDLS